MEIGQVANAGHVLGEIVDGRRPLQRQVVQIVVETQRDVAAHRGALQLLMAGSRAVHDHPGVRAGAVEDAVVGEFALLVQHAGIGRFAGIDLLDVARRRKVDQVRGVRPGDVDLLQAGHVHQPGLGADRDVLRRRRRRRSSRRSPCRSSLRASSPARDGDPPGSKISRMPSSARLSAVIRPLGSPAGRAIRAALTCKRY